MPRHVLAVLLFGTLVVVPASASADPLLITSGRIVLSAGGLVPNPAFLLQGRGFTLTNTMSPVGVAGVTNWSVACSSAAAGLVGSGRCRAGDLVDLSFSIAGELGTGPGTVGGRQYESLTYRGTLSASAAPVVFQPANEEAFGFAGATTPFVFAGLLHAFDGEREVFASALAGRGTAEMIWENEGERVGGRPAWEPSGDGDNGPVYRFVPTPEPSTLLLTTTALAAGLRFRKRVRA